jgi:hypothetical protein
VNDDEFDRNTPPVPDGDYEPPAVFDFGSVFTVTQGNAGGQADSGGQQS